jgi:U32 family peptidase
MTNKAELILPGGDLPRTKMALDYGADAVYIGLEGHSLRKGGVNFTIKEMDEAIKYAHSLKKKIYVTFNVFAHNDQLSSIKRDLSKIAALSPDAFIIADLGVFSLAKEVAPNIPIHISTQANTVNLEGVRFWKENGAKRVVLARELTLPEIKEIHTKVPGIELEVFVHGAMCISYSGRCLLSGYMTGRKANLGECAQPCRWQYDVYTDQNPNYYIEEKQRKGELFKIEESESGTAIMSSKDLRLIRYLPEILDAGVTGLKIEGRNKTEYYLAVCGLAYSTALKKIAGGTYGPLEIKRLEEELEKLNYREYNTGFILGEAKKGETYGYRSPVRSWDYVGQILHDKSHGAYEIVVKNKVSKNDKVEVVTPQGIIEDQVTKITSSDGTELKEISPGRENQMVIVNLRKSYPPKSLIRKIVTS